MLDKVKMKDGTIREIDWNDVDEKTLAEIDWDALYDEGQPCDDDGNPLGSAPEGKPYPNEHACRVRQPGEFQEGSIRRVERQADGKTLWLLIGRLKGKTTTTLQAFRYPKDEWNVTTARAHCKRHKGKEFEPAGPSKAADSNGQEAFFFSQEKDPTADLAEIGQAVDMAVSRGGWECHAEIKAVDEGRRIIEGYANTKDIDRAGEQIVPGAFRDSAARYRKTGVILLDHNPREPIGRPLDVRIDSFGMWIRGVINNGEGVPGLEYIEKAWAQIARGLRRAFSVGFKVLEDTVKDVGGKQIRIIKALDLFEVSVVTLPANVQSVFSVVKAMAEGTDLFNPRLGLWVPEWAPAVCGAISGKAEYPNTARATEELRRRLADMDLSDATKRMRAEIERIDKAMEGGKNHATGK